MKEADIRPLDLFNKFIELSISDIESIFDDKTSFVDVSCPACDSNDSEEGLFKYGFRYLICTNCASLYCSPRPNMLQLESFYQTSQSVEFWAKHFYHKTAKARRKLMFQPRAQLALKISGQNHDTNSDLVLVDVGSGYGMLLDEVQATGRFARVVGIEPNKEFASMCIQRGFEIINKSAEDLQPNDVNAHVATCFEVLEHVYNPCKFLTSIRNGLGIGGRLLLTTLTVTGFDIQILWENSKSLTPPHHLNIMSVDGIRCLMKRGGYRVLKIETPGKLDLDIVLNAYQENEGIERSRFVNILMSKDNGQTNEDFQTFLQKHLLSSHVRVVAERVN